jgi:hypothetical protein
MGICFGKAGKGTLEGNLIYSRQNPSKRYLGLIEQYKVMHKQGEKFLGIPPDATFPGQSLLPQAFRIKQMIDRHKANTILDYGSGKGHQYRPMLLRSAEGTTWNGVQDFWRVEKINCYDPCYEPYCILPSGKFEGVISTDVLEHCPEEDIDWILDEIFSYSSKFVFANVACYPARKRLPSGENAHITVYPKSWWESKIRQAAVRSPGVSWEFWIQAIATGPSGQAMTEEKIES